MVAGDRTLIAAPVEERVIPARGVVEGGRVGAGYYLHGAADHERLLDGREEFGGEGCPRPGGRHLNAVEVALRRVEAVEAARADALALLRGVAEQCRVDLATGEEGVGLIVGVVEEYLLARSGCQGLGAVEDTHGGGREAVDGGAAVGEVEVSVADAPRSDGRAALGEDADAVGAGGDGAEVELAVRICDRAADYTRAASSGLELSNIAGQGFVAFAKEAIGLTGLVEEGSRHRGDADLATDGDADRVGRGDGLRSEPVADQVADLRICTDLDGIDDGALFAGLQPGEGDAAGRQTERDEGVCVGGEHSAVDGGAGQAVGDGDGEHLAARGAPVDGVDKGVAGLDEAAVGVRDGLAKGAVLKRCTDDDDGRGDAVGGVAVVVGEEPHLVAVDGGLVHHGGAGEDGCIELDGTGVACLKAADGDLEVCIDHAAEVAVGCIGGRDGVEFEAPGNIAEVGR